MTMDIFSTMQETVSPVMVVQHSVKKLEMFVSVLMDTLKSDQMCVANVQKVQFICLGTANIHVEQISNTMILPKSVSVKLVLD